MGFMLDERERHIWYDAADNVTRVYTNDPKCMTKFKKANWKIVEETMEEGRVVAIKFESSGFPITARDTSKPKRTGNPNLRKKA